MSGRPVHDRRYYLANRDYILNRQKAHRKVHKAERAAYLKRTKDKRNELYKESAINMYSNGTATCGHCGQGDIDVLCLDHIDNDGYKERRLTGSRVTGIGLYSKLRQKDYPSGFQVLCANCNLKKEILHRRELYS